MEDIKDYLERANAEHWERLRKNPPAFLDEIGEEITTEAMDKIMWKHLNALCTKQTVLED